MAVARLGTSDTTGGYGALDNVDINEESILQSQTDEEEEREDDKSSVDEDEEEVEGWKGWVVVLASFLCIAILDGVGYTTGLLLNSLLQDLGGSRAEVSVAGSLQVGVYSLSGPIVGRLVTEWGTRPVCVLGATVSSLGMLLASFGSSLGGVLVGYSVVAGCGFGMMYIPSVVGAAPFFNKRRSLAIGICLCGSGIGTFTLAPITEFILNSYGWRVVFRTFSVMCLGCVVCGLCMFNKKKGADEEDKPPEEAEKPDDTQVEKLRAPYRVMDPSLYNNPNFPTFLIVVLADFMAFMGVYIPYTHLPPLALARNISASDAAFLISAGGISNTVGRFLGGWLCDIPFVHPFMILLASVVVSLIPSFTIPRMTSYGEFFSLFSVFGLATGCMVGASSPLLIGLLGLNALSQTFGLLTALRGVSAMVGPPLAGLLVDYLNDPGSALDLCGLLQLVSVSAYLVAILHHRLVTRRRNYIAL